jgi:hypothetical protein
MALDAAHHQMLERRARFDRAQHRTERLRRGELGMLGDPRRARGDQRRRDDAVGPLLHGRTHDQPHGGAPDQLRIGAEALAHLGDAEAP